MILITGIAAFIGSHLAENLVDRDIIGVDNFNDYYDPKIKRENWNEVKKNKNAVLKEGDIRDKEFLREIFKNNKIKTVVHLAAMAGVRPSLENPELYQDVNIKGTMNILECLKEFGIKNYVFASSSSVYGEKKQFPFKEDMKIDNPVSFYAATKKAGEEIKNVYHHLYKINTANLRFFTVYGPRQRPDLAINKFTKLIYQGKKIPVYANGEFKRDFTYIDDIIDGIKKSIKFVEKAEKAVFEIFNLGESDTIDVNSMIELIEKNMGKVAEKEYFPAQPGDVPITYADISKAKEMIDYSPVTKINSGIEKFIKWFLEKNS